MRLISECQNDVQVFSSFFYTKLEAVGVSGVRHWMKGSITDLFSQRLLLVPVHLGTHWCLATVNFEHHQLCYYDSMNGKNDRCLQLLEEYIMLFHHLHTISKWSTVYPQGIPQQKNHSDCGVFICMYARQLACSGLFNFSQEGMIQIRKHMIIELVFKKLL